MKKIFLILLPLLFVMNSCKKEIQNNTINQKLISIDDNELNKFRTNIQTIDEIINYDIKNIDNRKIQYTLGEALSSMNWTKEYVEAIINDAKNSPLKEANLIRVGNSNDQFLNELNSKINEIKKGEKLSTLFRKMLYDEVQYQPIIVIPNLDLIKNFELNPIISHGLDVEELTVDDILAVFIHENGIKTNILLNENEAVKSVKPIFIFDYGLDDTKYKDLELSLDLNQYYDHNQLKHDSVYYANLNDLKSTNGRSQKRFLNVSSTISNQSHFYDGCCGKNEFTQKAWIWTKYNNWGNEIYGSSSSINELRRFSKSECNGTSYSTWDRLVFFSHTYDAPNSPKDIFTYRVYERDWWRSQEAMATSYYSGKTLHPFAKMEKSYHVYIYQNWIYNTPAYYMWQYKNIGTYKGFAPFTRSH